MPTFIISALLFVGSVANSLPQPEVHEGVGGIIDTNGPVHFQGGNVDPKSKRHHKADKEMSRYGMMMGLILKKMVQMVVELGLVAV